MAKGKKLFSFVDVTENTPIQKLSVMDQVRVMIKKMSHDDAEELRADDAVTQNLMRLKADLMGFLDTALEPLRQGKKYAVSVLIPNEYDPVLDEVLSSTKIANFYTVKVTRPDIEYDIKYDIRIDLEVKE